MQIRNNKGFSLIELMIVITVVGILAALSIQGYNGYVLRSNRASEAIPTLLSAQSAVQEYYAQNNSTYPSSYTITSTTHYTYAYTQNTTTGGYSITATATGNQVSDTAKDGTACTTLTVDNVGTKSPASCWTQ